MKKQAIYLRTTSGRQRGVHITPDELETLCKRYIKVFSNGPSGVITIETSNRNIDSEIEQFKRVLETMKKYGIDTLLMTDKERISENNGEVYLMCKFAEESGIEIQFVKEEISSKDVVREFEENNMTGMEMNL